MKKLVQWKMWTTKSLPKIEIINFKNKNVIVNEFFYKVILIIPTLNI
jgi:hypothetical protein